jgi:hypothetical protein
MALNDPRLIFAGLCWFGMLAILLGAAWEIREKFAGGVLGNLHFGVRMISAACWLAALGLMSFAVMAKWPNPGSTSGKEVFARFLLAGLAFLLGAMLISIVDFALFLRIRKSHRRHLADQIDQWIHEELEHSSPEDNAESGK